MEEPVKKVEEVKEAEKRHMGLLSQSSVCTHGFSSGCRLMQRSSQTPFL